MTTLLMPDWAPARQSWGIRSSSQVSPASPFGGQVQRVWRPGDRWTCSITLPPLNDLDDRRRRSYMRSLLSQLRGQGNDILIADRSADHHEAGVPSSTLAPANLIRNGQFENETSDWAEFQCEVIAEPGPWCRIRYTSGGTAIMHQENALVLAKLYSFRYSYFTGLGVPSGANGNARVGISNGDTSMYYLSSFEDENKGTAVDRQVQGFLRQNAGDTNNRVDFRFSPATAAGDHMFIGGVEMARCAKTTGVALQGETAASITDLNYSESVQIHAGAMVQIVPTGSEHGQLVRLTRDVYGNADGSAKMYFEPPLREGLPPDSGVIVYRPRGRFILSSPEAAWEEFVGARSSVSLDFEEVF